MSEPTGLRISGLTDRVAEIAWDEIAALPETVADVGVVARGAVGRAVAMRPVIALATPTPAATHCTVLSRDGAYTASIPLEILAAGGWLAFALDGLPLSSDNGGPLRLTVAEGDTLCWNVKNVGELRFTAAKEVDSVPENPPH